VKEKRLVILAPGLRKGWKPRFIEAGYDAISATPKAVSSSLRAMQLIRPSYDHITFVGHKALKENPFDAAVYVSGVYNNDLILISWGREETLFVPSWSMDRIFLEVWAWLTEEFFPDDLTIP
jgi:hypothetical protein